MDLAPSPRAAELVAQARAFVDERVLPAEPEYAQWLAAHADGSHPDVPEVVERLKREARARGLWNLFLPDISGLSVVDYAHLAEVTGWSPLLAAEAMNCQAPDTGNMEVLHHFGTPAQKARWLEPLLEGRIRSAFAMTEPDVASSDATNIRTEIRRDGDSYVVNGRKWWTTGAVDPRCEVLVVMGRTDADAPWHSQQSMLLVPLDTPGVHVERSLPVFGFHDHQGHAEIRLDDVRVPVENILSGEGHGFLIAQARLGPGRVHHCMRAVGIAERALRMMCERAVDRVAFGKQLARQGVVQQQVAESRIEVEQARLLVLKTAWMIDQQGAQAARSEIAAIKVAAPRAALAVVDRAIQIHGGAGVSGDTPLSRMWAGLRSLRLADGPDEVHLRTVARAELGPYLGKPSTAEKAAALAAEAQAHSDAQTEAEAAPAGGAGAHGGV